jgi:hypothetical protein
MTQGWRRSVPAWRVHESRGLRLDWALGALLVMVVLLTEVWQSSTVAGLSVEIAKATGTLHQATAAAGWKRAALDKTASRSQLGPMAGALGLRPGDPGRIVSLPEAYLEAADARAEADGPAPLFAFAGKALQSLVPEAQARGRRVN